MGLDVYVGSLTRYYARDWETVVQKMGREQGLDVSVVRANDAPEDTVTDSDEISEIVEAWIKGLGRGLSEHLPPGVVFDWQDDMSSPYFTDKPGWDSYASLLLWAAYSEHPELTRPEKCAKELENDPAFQASTAEGFRSSYGLLLHDVELWVPVDFPFAFKGQDASGNKIGIGSCHQLLTQLEQLNRATWGADAATLDRWLQDAAESESPMEPGARFAFAVLLDLCREAVTNKLPMKLDY